MSNLGLRLSLPFTEVVSSIKYSRGSKKVLKLQSGWYFILETGDFAEREADITISKDLPKDVLPDEMFDDES